jgi:hypothetical protein
MPPAHPFRVRTVTAFLHLAPDPRTWEAEVAAAGAFLAHARSALEAQGECYWAQGCWLDPACGCAVVCCDNTGRPLAPHTTAPCVLSQPLPRWPARL